MIVDIKNNLVEGSEFKTKNSAIQNADTAKLYKVLTGLYSDIIGSIVREYTSNSIDSTVRANSNEPVLIHITENMFTVQDFGTGMTEEDMYNIYINFLTTTKDGNNKEIGGWGLGAKCALTYTPTFTIESTINGEKSTYLYYKNNEGIPALDKIMSVPEEGTGFKVCIPTLGKSQEFLTAIVKQLQLFSGVYVTTDVCNFEHSVNKFNSRTVYENEDFYSLDGTNHLDIAIGGVLYELNYNLITIPATLRMNKVQTPIIAKFDIGEIQPTPSRESIDYNGATIAIINNKLAAIAEHVEQLMSVPELSNDYSNPKRILDYKGVEVTVFKNASISKMIDIDISHADMRNLNCIEVRTLQGIPRHKNNRHSFLSSKPLFYVNKMDSNVLEFLVDQYPYFDTNNTILLTKDRIRLLIRLFRINCKSKISISKAFRFLVDFYNIPVVDIKEIKKDPLYISDYSKIKTTVEKSNTKNYRIAYYSTDHTRTSNEKLTYVNKTKDSILKLIGIKTVIRSEKTLFNDLLLGNHIVVNTSDTVFKFIEEAGKRVISMEEYFDSRGYKRNYTNLFLYRQLHNCSDVDKLISIINKDCVSLKKSSVLRDMSLYFYKDFHSERLDKNMISIVQNGVDYTKMVQEIYHSLSLSTYISINKELLARLLIYYLRAKKVKTSINYKLLRK